jgi:hypothetical protein
VRAANSGSPDERQPSFLESKVLGWYCGEPPRGVSVGVAMVVRRGLHVEPGRSGVVLPATLAPFRDLAPELNWTHGVLCLRPA